MVLIGDAYGHNSSFFTIGDKTLINGATTTVTGELALKKAIMHGIVRGMIHTGQGGKFGSGFASGFVSSAFSVGTELFGDSYAAVAGRTAIMAVIGGTTSNITGGKFANGAVSATFVHLFNGEYNTLGKALNGLWTKITDGTITNDITQGLEGGLNGYREVRDNSPWYAQFMLKFGMTTVEMGLTSWMTFAEYPMLHIWYNTTSGVYMDTYPYFNPYALSANLISGQSGMDTTWFKEN